MSELSERINRAMELAVSANLPLTLTAEEAAKVLHDGYALAAQVDQLRAELALQNEEIASQAMMQKQLTAELSACQRELAEAREARLWIYDREPEDTSLVEIVEKKPRRVRWAQYIKNGTDDEMPWRLATGGWRFRNEIECWRPLPQPPAGGDA